jgi:hypothetical protein
LRPFAADGGGGMLIEPETLGGREDGRAARTPGRARRSNADLDRRLCPALTPSIGIHLTRSLLLFAVLVMYSTITVDEFVWLLRCVYRILLVYFHG